MVDYPEIDLNVDRSKAGQVGLTQRDVANSLLISLSSSGQIAPTQWLDWRNGVSYGVAVQTPQYRMDSLDAVLRTPISAPFNDVNSTTATPSPAPPIDQRGRRHRTEPGLHRLRQSRCGLGQPAVALEYGYGGPQRRTGRSSTTTTCSR